MRSLGRALQFIALVLLPLAVILQLSGSLGRPFAVSEMLVMLVFGMCCFGIGRILEGYAGR